MELTEILARASEHDCTVLDNDDGYSPNYCFGEAEIQSFVAAVEQQAYERGLEGAARMCEEIAKVYDGFGRESAHQCRDEIRAMKGST